MQDKFETFKNNVLNQFVEVSDSTNLNQCVDLSYLWTFCLDFPKASVQHFYAYQIFTEPNDLTRKHFEIIPNTPTGIPSVGSLIIWKSGFLGSVAGHVAISTEKSTVNVVEAFSQNLPLKSKAIIIKRDYNGVLGWLKPKIEQPSTTPIITDQTKLDFGVPVGILEFQQVRSKLVDQDRDIAIKNAKIKDMKILAGQIQNI